MPKYLFRASLSPEGVAGVLAEGGTARRKVLEESIGKAGGSLEAFYFAFGDDDALGIVEMPDEETAAAFAMEISSSGRISVSTTVLLTPEQVDAARNKTTGWRAPGT